MRNAKYIYLPEWLQIQVKCNNFTSIHEIRNTLECAFKMVRVAKHLVTLWRPLCQMTRGSAGFQDSGVLGELRAGSSVLLVRCKSTSSSPYKGLLGWDRSWGFESQVRLPNSECHLSAYPSFGPVQTVYSWLEEPAETQKMHLPFSRYHVPRYCSNCKRRSVQHMVACGHGNYAIISTVVLQPCPASVWDNVEWVNLHVDRLLHAGQAQHLFCAEYVLHLNHSFVQLL